MPAENIVVSGQLSFVIGFSFLLAEFAILFEEACHLRGEVDVTVTRSGFGFFDNYILTCDFDHVPADMDGLLFEVQIAPFQATALAPAHTSGYNQLEISFVLDAFFFQRGNEFLSSFLIRHVLLFLLFASIFIGTPRWIMRQKAALHRIGEDATQASVDTLYSAFGERLSGNRILLLTKFSVQIAEMFRLEVGQLVAAQVRHEAVNVLLVTG